MCKKCDDKQNDIFKGRGGNWYMRIENSNWDAYNDGFDYQDVKINYCPFCGRKLN